jgi:hypothetical protein
MIQRGHSTGEPKLPLMRRLRYWWWGGTEVPNWDEPTWTITFYPPGPGARLAELGRYFREHWKEFVFGLVGTIVAALILALVGAG